MTGTKVKTESMGFVDSSRILVPKGILSARYCPIPAKKLLNAWANPVISLTTS